MYEPKGVALITVAFSGIGAASTRILANHGMHIILTARRQERLFFLKIVIDANGDWVVVIPADLTQRKIANPLRIRTH